MANDELYTPKKVFDALKAKFDLDVCAPHDQTYSSVPAEKWFCICCADGLVDEWHGMVWMNPPFSKPSPWVDKFLSHANGIALLPLSGNSQWWQRIWKSEATCIMIPPNLGFTNPQGKIQKIMYGISLWALGDGVEYLKNSNLGHWR